MSRRKLYSIVGSIGALAAVTALALALVFSQGGAGPAGSSPAPVVSALTVAQPSSEAATSGGVPAESFPPGGPVSQSGLEPVVDPAPSGGGPAEGIKVHVHWTIEVREPDGTLASRTEFENALRTEGATGLISFLARTKFPGFWRVFLVASGLVVQPCGVNNFCVIAEPDEVAVIASSSKYKNLTVTVPLAGQPNAGKLVLSGSATAQANTSILLVQTYLGSCPSSTPCDVSGGGGVNSILLIFSESTLSPAVAVSSGQSVSVTVVISFS